MNKTFIKNHYKFLIVFTLLFFSLISVLSIPKVSNAQNYNFNQNNEIHTVTHGVPGKMTVENEIKTGLMAVGHCLYIYGGGWNEEPDPIRGGQIADTGANKETKTLGVSEKWDNFYKSQDSNFTPWDVPELDYNENPKCVHYGIDCSGFLGWVFQNITNNANGFDNNAIDNPGWVAYAQNLGWALQHKNYGKIIFNEKGDIQDNKEDPYEEGKNITNKASNTNSKTIVKNKNDEYDFVPGNIYTFGNEGEYHCWMCLGKCADNSVLLLHSSDPGVFICGTSKDYDEDHPLDCDSDALKIARTYMKRYYTDFYNKFGVRGRLGNFENDVYSGYLKFTEFNWDKNILTDDLNLRKMTPNNLMTTIFCEDTATGKLISTGDKPTVHINDALIDTISENDSTIVYNKQSDTDTNVDIKLDISNVQKFDSVMINNVDYSNLVKDKTNTVSVTVPRASYYKIETQSSSSDVTPPVIPVNNNVDTYQSAQTGDNYYLIIILTTLVLLTSVLIFIERRRQY